MTELFTYYLTTLLSTILFQSPKQIVRFLHATHWLLVTTVTQALSGVELKYQNTRIPKYQKTQYPNTKIPKYQNTKISTKQNTKISKYQNSKVPKYQITKYICQSHCGTSKGSASTAMCRTKSGKAEYFSGDICGSYWVLLKAHSAKPNKSCMLKCHRKQYQAPQ